MGSQITDLTGNVILGAAEVGDELIIQDMEDVDGGAYVVTSVDTVEPEGEDYSGSYATLGVEPLGEFTRGSVGPAETCVLKLKKSSAAPVIEGDYLPLSGGAIAGNLSVSGSLSNQGGIMLAGPKDKGFYVYDLQGGAVFSAYGDKFGAGVRYFGAVEQANHVATKAYVDEQVGGIEIPEAGGGSFITAYDGNRFYKPGTTDTASV